MKKKTLSFSFVSLFHKNTHYQIKLKKHENTSKNTTSENQYKQV